MLLTEPRHYEIGSVVAESNCKRGSYCVSADTFDGSLSLDIVRVNSKLNSRRKQLYEK